MVILASLRSWATPVMSACSTGRSSIDPVTIVPGLCEYDERTWIGTPNRRAYSTHRNMQHLRAARGQLEHLFVRDLLDVPGVRHDPRVGGEDAVDVGVDLADVGVQRGGQRDGGGVRAAPARAW